MNVMRMLDVKSIVMFLFIIALCSSAKGQQNTAWKMKTIPIPTRWDKDVNPSNVLPEYPRPQMVRNNNWKSLNGLWEYAITSGEVTKPDNFDGSILVPFPIESALSGVKKKLLPSELLWYKRSFVRPSTNATDRVLLHFGAVDWQATVFLNGREVIKHKGGYTSFSVDITDALKNGNNELIVKVFDPSDKGIGPHGKQVLNPGNIYYTPTSGIWQTVWLETVPASYISELIMTPDVDKRILNVKIKAPIGFFVELIARDGKGKVSRIKGMADSVLKLTIPNVKLWSPENPFLYDLTIRLTKSNAIVDEVKSYFGMRKIEIKKDEKGIDRIFLNNKPYFNLGVLDQGFWPDGLYTAPSDDALKFDIEVIKAMGFNTIRKHIKVESARWYYHADKIGILVWQDFVNPNQRLPEGAKAEYEKEAQATLEQLHNNPSIVAWVIFNEKWGQYDQKRITEWVKNYDPSRLVNGHSGELLYVNNHLRDSSSDAWISSDMTDVHSYPMPRNAPAQSGKARVLGEFGGIGVPVEGHLWNDLVTGWGYDGVVTPAVLQMQYTQMIDSLIVYAKEGLSASIYTQPFDVESEQNGLMTYDRSIIKLPIATIQDINSHLLPKRNNYSFNIADFSINVADTGRPDFNSRLNMYNYGKKDSLFLRILSIMAYNKKDTAISFKVSNDYIQLLIDPLSEINLLFIHHFTLSTEGAGFSILFNNKQYVDDILGENVAENAIMKVIYDEKIKPNLTEKKINWNLIEKEVIPKYGELGEERIWGAKLVHYYEQKDWENFGIYYKLYFDKVIPLNRNYFHINNFSWPIFENITDSSILRSAVRTMRYNIENFDGSEPDALDTYANLLYKIGNKDEAIFWEQKAVKLSNNRDIKRNYEKMLKNEKTWK